MTMTDCKKKLSKYIIWVNENPGVLTEEQNMHLKLLITKWRSIIMTEGKGLRILYDMKEDHSYINGHSGNEDLWMSYIIAAMTLRSNIMLEKAKV
jgi:hypothetical protein